jgi:hypothetical protein
MAAKKFPRRIRLWLVSPLVEAIRSQHDILRSQYDMLLQSQHAEQVIRAKNPLNRFGAKFFSQTDEDGITLEVVRARAVQPPSVRPASEQAAAPAQESASGSRAIR